MKSVMAFVLVWFVAGAGAVGGSILGNAFGKTGLMAGAVIGGALASMLGAWLSVRAGWIPRATQGSAVLGAAIGFVVAAPIAGLNLHTPVIPILACGLTGAGALIGAQIKIRR